MSKQINLNTYYYKKSDIDTFLENKANLIHVHGNISNDGKVGTAANKPLITGTNGVIQASSFGTAANTFCQGNDSRLSDARTPKSHTHTKAEISDFPTSMTPTSHTHGNITNAGAIGSTANLPVITTTSGKLTTGSFGKNANTFAEGNHEHAVGALTSGNIDEITDDNVYGIPKARISDGSITGTLPPTTKTGGVRSFLLETRKYDGNNSVQFAYTLTTTNDYNRVFYRIRTGNEWYTWRELINITTFEDELDNKANAIHTHGDITSAGAIGSTANLPVITTTSGKLTTGSFGTDENTFCQGNDERLSDARTPKSHTHFLGDINVTGALTANDDLNNYTNAGIYICSKTNSGTLGNKPYSINASCIIENKQFSSGNIVQFVYKVTASADTSYDTYFRCYTGGDWRGWVRIYTDKDFVVSDSLTDTSAKNALSAKQGKVLNDKLNAMQTVDTGNITTFNSVYGASGQVSYIKYNGWVAVNYYNLKITSTPSGTLKPLFSLPYKALEGIGNYLFYTKNNEAAVYPTTNIQANIAYNGVLMYPTSD